MECCLVHPAGYVLFFGPRFKQQPIPAVTPSTHNQGSSPQGPAALEASSPTNKNRGCLIAPSSNPGPPRVVFSASLERTLSSRKKISASSPSPSWTTGGRLIGNSASSLSLSSRQQLQSDGEGATGGLASLTHSGESAPRSSTREDKKATGKRQWKGFRSHHQHQSLGVEGAATTKSTTVPCPRDSNPAAKAGVPVAAAADELHDFSREEGGDQPRRRRLRTRWGRPKQQDLGETSSSSSTRKGSREASRSGSNVGDKLPMVKCWEGRAEKEADIVVEEEERTTPRRTFRGQSHAETTLRRPRIKNSTTAYSEERPGGKIEGGTNPRVVGRGERVAFGLAFTERALTHHRGRGEARSVTDDLIEATDDDERSGGAKVAPLQLPLTAEDTYDSCEGNMSLSSVSSVAAAQGVSVSLLPPMGTATTVATDLIFEDSSFEDSGASASLASPPEKNALDIADIGGTGSGGGGSVDRASGSGGGDATRRKRGGAGPRQRSGSVDAFVRTRYNIM